MDLSRVLPEVQGTGNIEGYQQERSSEDLRKCSQEAYTGLLFCCIISIFRFSHFIISIFRFNHSCEVFLALLSSGDVTIVPKCESIDHRSRLLIF